MKKQQQGFIYRRITSTNLLASFNDKDLGGQFLSRRISFQSKRAPISQDDPQPTPCLQSPPSTKNRTKQDFGLQR